MNGERLNRGGENLANDFAQFLMERKGLSPEEARREAMRVERGAGNAARAAMSVEGEIGDSQNRAGVNRPRHMRRNAEMSVDESAESRVRAIRRQEEARLRRERQGQRQGSSDFNAQPRQNARRVEQPRTVTRQAVNPSRVPQMERPRRKGAGR